MLNRDKLLAAIRSFFTLSVELEGDEKIASFTDDGLDWSLLVEEIDDETGNVLDIDMEEAIALGGDPGVNTPIDPDVTVNDLVEFMLSQPVLTVDRVVRKQVGKLVGIDTDMVPEGFKIQTAELWMRLFRSLNAALQSQHNCELELDKWKAKGQSCKPSVTDIIALADEAYTAEIA